MGLRVALCSGLLLSLLFSNVAPVAAAGFTAGDILVALTNGTIQVRAADGTLKGTLMSGINAQAKGLALNEDGDLLVSLWFSADIKEGNTILKFHPDGTMAGTFGSGYSCNPSGIVIDDDENVYVGQADCDGDILKFNADGTLIKAFDVATEVRGARWLDLAADGCTLFYTSAGQHVSRYNACTQVQLPDFNSNGFPEGSEALGLHILPDGGLIVAATTTVFRLDSGGNVVAQYDTAGDHTLVSVFLNSEGKSFWTASYLSGSVYRFDIATGAILQSFNTGIAGVGAKSVLVVPDTPVRPPSTNGRMTGGGSFRAADGTIVHHGFELRCNNHDHRQSLEVNWGKGEKFHLDQVTSAVCSDDPTIDPEHPPAPIDTLTLSGTGRLKDKTTGTIQLTFTDAGEPGVNDGVFMIIRNAQGNVVLNVSATTLIHGNHQAHRTGSNDSTSIAGGPGKR